MLENLNSTSFGTFGYQQTMHLKNQNISQFRVEGVSLIIREILRCLQKRRAIHLDRSNGYKIGKNYTEKLKLWVET